MLVRRDPGSGGSSTHWERRGQTMRSRTAKVRSRAHSTNTVKVHGLASTAQTSSATTALQPCRTPGGQGTHSDDRCWCGNRHDHHWRRGVVVSAPHLPHQRCVGPQAYRKRTTIAGALAWPRISAVATQRSTPDLLDDSGLTEPD